MASLARAIAAMPRAASSITTGFGASHHRSISRCASSSLSGSMAGEPPSRQHRCWIETQSLVRVEKRRTSAAAATTTTEKRVSESTAVDGAGVRSRRADTGRGLTSVGVMQERQRAPWSSWAAADFLPSRRGFVATPCDNSESNSSGGGGDSATKIVEEKAAAAIAAARGGSGGRGSGGGIYRNPKVYELAFGFRDFASEVSFLRQLSEKHGA